MLPVLVRELAHMGPIGAVLLGAPLAAWTASIVALALRGPAGRVACAVAGSSFAVSMLAAWAAVHGGRERFVRGVLDPDPASSAWPSLDLARAVLAEHAGAGTALVVGPLVAAALAVTWARGGGASRATACGLAIAVVTPAWIAAGACFVASGALVSTSWSECGARCRYEEVMDASTAIDAASPWLPVVGGVVAMACIAAILVTRRASPRGLHLGCLALGLGGLAAYMSTRDMADDAARPLPFDEPVSWSSVELDTLPAVGSAGCTDCADVEGPILLVSAAGAVSVDGTPVTDLAALLAAKRSLWLQLHPGRALDTTVLVEAPASVSARLPLNAVAIAHQAGFVRVVAALARPVPAVASRTLGTISRAPRLCAGVVVEGVARDGEQWGERVRSGSLER
jgi:hypothetical protein